MDDMNFYGAPVEGVVDWLALTLALIAMPFVLLLAACYHVYKKIRP